MIVLIILGYILPLIINFIVCYCSDDILTRRDLLNWSWAYLIPVLNIYVILVFVLHFLIAFIESKINKNWWNNFLDKRL